MVRVVDECALIRLLVLAGGWVVSGVGCGAEADFFQQHRDKEAQLLSAELLALAKVRSMHLFLSL